MKGQGDWYKREPRKILDACRGRGTDFIAIYNTILDLMYERGGACPNDPAWIAGWIGCDRRKVSFHISKLIELGKLRVDERNELHNPKADEVMRRRTLSAVEGESGGGRPEVGRRSARGRGSVSYVNLAENNDLDKIPSRESQKEREIEKVHSESDPTDSSVLPYQPDSKNPPLPPNGGKATKGGRKSLSSQRTAIGDYVPTDDDKRRAAKYWRSHGREDLVQRGASIVEAFVSHHKSRGTRMVDWPAAWQTWYANELRTAPPRQNGPRPVASSYRTDADGYELVSDADMLLALKMFYGLDGGEPGVWMRERRGPAPGEPGCRVKPELIAQVKPRSAA